MNCKQCQEKILEALASDAALLPSEVSAHRETCPVCREFYETEASLFHAMDSGLQAIVNEKVPLSLIPDLRAELHQQPIASRAWNPSWSFALVAALAVLAMGAGFFRHGPQIRPNPSEIGPVASRGVGNSMPAVYPPPKLATGGPHRSNNRASSAATLPAPAEPPPEVIVLAEERAAFAKFVAKLPEEKEVALALTQPAPAAPDAPVEIALLEIGSVEVKPLEATARE